MLGSHRLEGDEADTLEAACVWKPHKVQGLYLSTIAPILPHIILLSRTAHLTTPCQWVFRWHPYSAPSGKRKHCKQHEWCPVQLQAEQEMCMIGEYLIAERHASYKHPPLSTLGTPTHHSLQALIDFTTTLHASHVLNIPFTSSRGSCLPSSIQQLKRLRVHNAHPSGAM